MVIPIGEGPKISAISLSKHSAVLEEKKIKIKKWTLQWKIKRYSEKSEHSAGWKKGKICKFKLQLSGKKEKTARIFRRRKNQMIQPSGKKPINMTKKVWRFGGPGKGKSVWMTLWHDVHYLRFNHPELDIRKLVLKLTSIQTRLSQNSQWDLFA